MALSGSDIRQVAIEAGYTVHERSSHGRSHAYDWGPKSPMESRHFDTEVEAWRAVDRHVKHQIEVSRKLMSIVARYEKESN